MRLPRTLRFDRSDDHVYAQAAAAGEWAIPGTFAFLDLDLAAADAKARQAYRHGWLGLDGFGRASLVETAEIEEADFLALVERLAAHLVAAWGAPTLELARAAALAELRDAASLADHPTGTLLMLDRAPTEDGVRERVKVVRPERADAHAKIWEIAVEES